MTQPRRDAKSRLLARVQWEWSAFQDSIESLTEADHLLTGVVDDWSVRDLLVHTTSWKGEALKAIPIILEGSRLPRYYHLYGGIDAFNALEQASKMHLSLAQVRADMRVAHQRLLSCLAGLPSGALTSGGRACPQDPTGHMATLPRAYPACRRMASAKGPAESRPYPKLNAHKGR